MPQPAKVVVAGLERKGFRRRDGADIFLHLYVDGKKTPIYTKVSHGEKEIHDGLPGTMARQLKLNKRHFTDLVKCSMTETEYVQLLREGEHIG